MPGRFFRSTSFFLKAAEHSQYGGPGMFNRLLSADIKGIFNYPQLQCWWTSLWTLLNEHFWRIIPRGKLLGQGIKFSWVPGIVSEGVAQTHRQGLKCKYLCEWLLLDCPPGRTHHFLPPTAERQSTDNFCYSTPARLGFRITTIL